MNIFLPVIALSCYDVPDADIVISGGGGKFCSTPTPGERTDGMDVSCDDLGDATGQEVPDNDSSVVASDSKEGAKPVEAAGDCHGDTVQRSIEFLRIILSK